MDPFEVFAYWDSKENQPQLTMTLTLEAQCNNTLYKLTLTLTNRLYSNL